MNRSKAKFQVPTSLLVQSIAFMLFTAWALMVGILGDHLITDAYGSAGRVAVLVGYLIIAVGFVVHLRGGNRSRLLNAALWVVVSLVGLAIVPYLLGGLGNFLKAPSSNCGLADGQVNCILDWQFGLWGSLSLAFWPIAVTLSLLALAGIWQAAHSKP
jgi:hypothetical protein